MASKETKYTAADLPKDFLLVIQFHDGGNDSTEMTLATNEGKLSMLDLMAHGSRLARCESLDDTDHKALAKFCVSYLEERERQAR